MLIRMPCAAAGDSVGMGIGFSAAGSLLTSIEQQRGPIILVVEDAGSRTVQSQKVRHDFRFGSTVAEVRYECPWCNEVACARARCSSCNDFRCRHEGARHE